MRLPATQPGTCRIYNICVPVHTVSTVTIVTWDLAQGQLCSKNICLNVHVYPRRAARVAWNDTHHVLSGYQPQISILAQVPDLG